MYGQWSGSPDYKTIVSSAIFDNKFPMAVPSGDGGSIVVFASYAEVTDDGTFPLPALCLQKIKSDGTVAWGTTESPIIIDSTIEDEWFSEPKLQVKADGYGGVYVLWAQVFYKDSIFVQHIDSSGRPLWGPTGKLVYSMENQQFAPGLSICAGSDSSVIVGWNSMNNATNRHSLYAQRYNALGAELWGANGKNVCPAIGSRMGQLVPDGANGIIAFFNDSRNSGMYGQRIDSGGNFRWTSEGINICPVPGARYISPGITHYGEASYAVADGNGGIIVMFNDKRNVTLDSMFGQAVENNIDIYAQKIDADGNLPWGQAGVAVAIRKARVNDICEKVFSDGNGGAIVQYENVSNMVDGTCKLTQRISADGDRQWGDSGIVLTRGRIDEFYSNIQTDESGNTYAGFLYIPQPYHEFATPLLSVRK